MSESRPPPAPSPAAPSPRPRRVGGFTLVELMVVIVIIGSLVALVGPNVFKAIFTSSVKTAETQMSNFESAIKMYYADKRKMPESLEELAEQDESGNAYLDSIPKDPWDREYSYRRLEKNKYIIRCLGEDGAEGTEDDIVRPPEAKE